MKNTINFLKFIALIAIIGFTVTACGDGSDDTPNLGGYPGLGSGAETWRETNSKTFTVTDGIVGEVSSESNTTYSGNTRTFITTTGGVTTTNTDTTTRTGNVETRVQTSVGIYDGIEKSSVLTATTTYDAASGLAQKITQIMVQTEGGIEYPPVSLESSMTIELLSTGLNERTFKSSYSYSVGIAISYITTRINNNGVILESKYFNNDDVLTQDAVYYNNGVLQQARQYIYDNETGDLLSTLTNTYSFPQDPIIRSRLPEFTILALSSFSEATQSITSESTQTYELVSSSSTELIIRTFYSVDGVLTSQTDTTYRRWN